jgi:NADH dehydrogenase
MNIDRLPGLAQVAIQSGRHTASTIVHRLSGDRTQRPFKYRDRGTMATISRFHAIASIGRVQSSGFSAWLLWLGVHLYALTGFKNRIAVLANWLIAFLGRGRPQRVITAQQVFGREALAAEATAITAAVSVRPASTSTTLNEPRKEKTNARVSTSPSADATGISRSA